MAKNNTHNVDKLHDLIVQRLDRFEALLNRNSEVISLIHDALRLYRQRHIDDQLKLRSAPQRLLQTFATDPDISYPQRKILEFLLRQFDHAHQRFQEVHSSKLVREARLGRGRAKEYLSTLEHKGYIQKRSDGYRVFYRINPASIDNKGSNTSENSDDRNWNNEQKLQDQWDTWYARV